MQFPEGFVEKYEAILEDEARDFLASFKQEAVSAFRVNPLKESQLSFACLLYTSLFVSQVNFSKNKKGEILWENYPLSF